MPRGKMKVLDKKAQQILFRTYWSSAGWKSKLETTSEDFDYALKAGYMFKPVILSHDNIVDWVLSVTKKVDLQQISNAFLSSLSSRRLDWRSALGSYAIARHFPKHQFSGKLTCNVCGEVSKPKQAEDLSVLNFERLKWGGVRHLSPLYIAFDLEQFSKTDAHQPTPKDFEIFNDIIETAKLLDGNARPRDLEKALSKIVESNTAEREILIQILGFCGILQPQKQEGFFGSFVNYNEREERPVNKIDWSYPISWWRGVDGVSKDALAFFFPQVF
jgi:hypothetical protein